MSDMATELRRAKLRKDLDEWREKLAHAESKVVEINKAKAAYRLLKPWQESCQFCHDRVNETKRLLAQIEEGAD